MEQTSYTTGSFGEYVAGEEIPEYISNPLYGFAIALATVYSNAYEAVKEESDGKIQINIQKLLDEIRSMISDEAFANAENRPYHKDVRSQKIFQNPDSHPLAKFLLAHVYVDTWRSFPEEIQLCHLYDICLFVFSTVESYFYNVDPNQLIRLFDYEFHIEGDKGNLISMRYVE